MSNRTESLWRATHQLPSFPPLSADLTTEVAIVGGGISGLTAAVILSRASESSCSCDIVVLQGNEVTKR